MELIVSIAGEAMKLARETCSYCGTDNCDPDYCFQYRTCTLLDDCEKVVKAECEQGKKKVREV